MSRMRLAGSGPSLGRRRKAEPINIILLEYWFNLSRRGYFELADDGSIFLDEVGEFPLQLQGKLLRVLQEGEYQRVGEEITRKVDVRVIAATNKNLNTAIASQQFREDLYYRLNVFPIDAVPLRQRRDDIPLLAEYFVKTVSQKLTRQPPQLSYSYVRQHQAYDWPGNIRELKNLIKRVLILNTNAELSFQLPTSSPNLKLNTVAATHESDLSLFYTRE